MYEHSNLSIFDVTSAILMACLGVLPVVVILGLLVINKHVSQTTLAGALPQKWYSTSGSTPKQPKIVHWE